MGSRRVDAVIVARDAGPAVRRRGTISDRCWLGTMFAPTETDHCVRESNLDSIERDLELLYRDSERLIATPERATH